MKFLVTLITLLSFFSYERVELSTTANSSISIKGTSTLHDWTMVTNEIDAVAVVYASADEVTVESFKGSINVTTLKSGKDQMDKNAYNTLKSDKYPTITFNLVKVLAAQPEQQLITALFDVTISGTTKQLEVEATAIPEGENAVVVKGSKNLKMTDFGIKPPSFMFGAIKTGDDLVIDFNLTLSVTKKVAAQDTNF